VKLWWGENEHCLQSIENIGGTSHSIEYNTHSLIKDIGRIPPFRYPLKHLCSFSSVNLLSLHDNLNQGSLDAFCNIGGPTSEELRQYQSVYRGDEERQTSAPMLPCCTPPQYQPYLSGHDWKLIRTLNEAKGRRY
jgi:hypothetical protein